MVKMVTVLLILYTVMEYYAAIEFKGGGKVTSILVEILISAAAAAVVLVPFETVPLVCAAGSFFVVHTLSRVGRFIYRDVLGKKISRWIFIARQLVLVSVVLLLSWLFTRGGAECLGLRPWVPELPYRAVMKGILAVLLITKPVNVIFRSLFPDLKPPEIGRVREKAESLKVGALIGSLERLLILACLLVHEYMGIGLVFTAKSITRYKRISMQREFAEYYLLGTLYSIIAALAVYALVFVVL